MALKRKLSSTRGRKDSEYLDNLLDSQLQESLRLQEDTGNAKHDDPPVKRTANGIQKTNGVKGPGMGEALYKTKFVNGHHDAYDPSMIAEPPVPQDNGALATRHDVESIFEQFAHVIHVSSRTIPGQTGGSWYHTKDEPTGFWSDLKTMGLKDLHTVRRIMETKATGTPQDDREYLMEAIIRMTSALPPRSKNRVELTTMFLDELWNGLQHPPLSYLGDDFKYRSADGSRNSYALPKLGAANTPYARSVNPVTVTPGAPPDPFLLFDSLMARKEFVPNPNKVSSIFFNFASLVVHDLFQTDHTDYSISKTSSYLDLSILYGDSQEDQDQMRTFKDGKIKPDCFAEERLLAFPPSAGVMLILFNRFHNYVVEQLAAINEGNRFAKPSSHLAGERAEQAWRKYDNDLFQTGRLVTCGLYINITLYDYLRTIVNLNRTNSTWTLDPRVDKPKNLATDGTPKGVGNQVSAEFALCYRWHACIGQTDEAWMETVYEELFNKKPDDVNIRELMVGLSKYDDDLPDDPVERPFAHLKRGPDGKYDDGELAKIMTTGIEQVSGAFGARNTPKAMRAISVLGIQQARSWNLCTFNEFRSFFGLRKFETFEEMNSDPAIVEQLRNLYEHPDYVELYPGIMVEEAKTPMVPGVGICPNHTLARAVLSDAVALVRGDRFYTVDYNPKNLTAWGYNEVAYDLSIDQGCVFYKLMMCALPNHFKPDSIYCHYPMTIPEENANIMKDLGRFHDYDYDKPTYESPPTHLTSHASVKYALENDQDFKTIWYSGLERVLATASHQSYLGDTTAHKRQRETMSSLIYRDNWETHIKHFYQYITLKLIHENTVDVAGYNQIDITRDVGNIAPVHFASNMFNLPLKSVENAEGVFSEGELWMALSVISSAITSDLDPISSYPVKTAARKLAHMLGKLMEEEVKSIGSGGLFARLFHHHHENANALAEYGVHTIRALSKTGMTAHDIAFSQIMPTAVEMVPDQSRGFTEILDYYLGPGNKHLPDIQKLAQIDSAESDKALLQYVREGIRLNGTSSSLRLAGVKHTFREHQGKVHVKPGDRIFCNIAAAAKDPIVCHKYDEVDLTRSVDCYLHYGSGANQSLSRKASEVALTAMLRTVAKLPGLRRAPGPQGQLKRVPGPDGLDVYMREGHESTFAFPCTMKIHYDGAIPTAPKAVVEH